MNVLIRRRCCHEKKRFLSLVLKDSRVDFLRGVRGVMWQLGLLVLLASTINGDDFGVDSHRASIYFRLSDASCCDIAIVTIKEDLAAEASRRQ